MTDVRQYLMAGPAAEHYYQQTERKHFPAEEGSGTGSEFRDPRALNLMDLLELAQEQRGSLEGDDHQVLGDPGRSGVYYLAVEVSGVTGALPARDLPAGCGLLVLRSKDGVPPDYLVFGMPRPRADIATLVMADERDVSGELTGKRVLLTCHPGLPMPLAGEHRDRYPENTVLRCEEVSRDETVLVGDISNVGMLTIEALQCMLDRPVTTNEEMGEALAQVASLPPALREKAQGVLCQAWSIGDHYCEEEYEVATSINEMAALALQAAIAEHCRATGETSRVRLTAPLPSKITAPDSSRPSDGFPLV